jgi:tRNA threonylcarbamoyladenosine modification (KEOPS) complex  Pcc1 subunit
LEVEISIEYDDARTAEAIGNAVSPDNHGTPKGLSVKTRSEQKRVVTSIECQRSFPTFIATVDDILFSIAIAENTLRETAKTRTHTIV